jgi:hypothetical protein
MIIAGVAIIENEDQNHKHYILKQKNMFLNFYLYKKILIYSYRKKSLNILILISPLNYISGYNKEIFTN